MEIDRSKYYFTGKKCKNGHIDKRFRHNGACYSCVQAASLACYYRKKRDIVNASLKEQIDYWVSKHKKPKISTDCLTSLCYKALEEFESVSFYNERDTNKLFWASIDKIDPNLGYQCGNIVVVPMWLNMLKSDAFIEEVVSVVAEIDWNSVLDYYS